MSRNPYVIEGQPPSLKETVFVFMDILGFTDLVVHAQRDGTSAAVLADLHDALSSSRQSLQDPDFIEEMKTFGEKDAFVLKAFTDNIVIGWPIHSDAESEFGSAFLRLTAFQFNMAIRGYFVRGAISVAEAYIDDIAVFGDALIEAYVGESKLARDPRIVLTDSAVKTAKSHLRYWGDPKDAPHSRDILKDADGQWFLNYLDQVLIAESDRGPFYEEFMKHKEMVEAKLTLHVSNPPIWSKYAWVAGYHNYFCDLHPEHFGAEHRIDVDLFRSKPSRIFE